MAGKEYADVLDIENGQCLTKRDKLDSVLQEVSSTTRLALSATLTIDGVQAERPDASRMIFVQEHEYLKCIQLGGENERVLTKQHDFPAYLFTRACELSNGYAGSAITKPGSNRRHNVFWLRCLIKKVDSTTLVNNKYTWTEVTFLIRQRQNGTVFLLAFGVPHNFHLVFQKALETMAVQTPSSTIFERVEQILFQELVRLYDDAVWAMSQAIRTLEKTRPRGTDLDTFFDFAMMHELLRHVIHLTEVLEVAIESCKIYTSSRRAQCERSQSSSHGDIEEEAHLETLDFACRLLHNFALRSQSNVQRLKNEINLALNIVQQNDSRASIELADSANKDSTAVKIISLVTLIFFPATFVSTLFGMSFFDYQEGGRWSVTEKFWIYWAVVCPLTIVTVGAWLAGQIWYSKKRKTSDRLRWIHKRRQTAQFDPETKIQ